MKSFYLTLLLVLLLAGGASARGASLLKEVEEKYKKAKSVEMDVLKKLRIPLLEKEKISEGVIKIRNDGKFKWEIKKPEHSVILLTPQAAWVVDYPKEESEKISVLKTKTPPKNQSPAIVAFLMGKGSLSKGFKIANVTDEAGGRERVELLAKSKNEAVKSLTLEINKKNIAIDKISFEDAMGNQTDLEFKNVKFDVSFGKDEFQLNLPKNSDVNEINE